MLFKDEVLSLFHVKKVLNRILVNRQVSLVSISPLPIFTAG